MLCPRQRVRQARLSRNPLNNTHYGKEVTILEQPRQAAAYLRVSTNEQAEFSPAAQLSAIEDYARKNSYNITPENVFIDEGLSGRKAERRPAFMRMIAMAKQKPAPFEAILVHKIDRFARSREDSVVYKSLLRRECGVKVISITENIEDDKFSVILEAMLEAMAEYYSLNLSEEVKKGMTEKAKRGGLQSTPSFGYSVKDNQLIQEPEEAEIVKQIFARFTAGEGYFAIARRLNALGVRTHRGNAFENRTIEYILRNPVYIGKIRWTPSGKVRRDFHHPDTLIVSGGHDAIIDTHTWNLAQARVSELKMQWRKHGRPEAEHRDWISGLVRCASCRSTLVQSGKRYWRCGAYAKGKCKTSQHMSGEKLKRMILAGLRTEMEYAYPLEATPIEISVSGKQEQEYVQARLLRIDGKLERVREAYINGVDSLEAYQESKIRIAQERMELEKELSALCAQQSTDLTPLDARGALCDVLTLLAAPEIAVKDKHHMAHKAIKEIVVDKDANLLEITYYFV